MDEQQIICSSCNKPILNSTEIGCVICSEYLCSECTDLVGKWTHLREVCDCCIDASNNFHDLFFVCSDSCEQVLRHTMK